MGARYVYGTGHLLAHCFSYPLFSLLVGCLGAFGSSVARSDLVARHHGVAGQAVRHHVYIASYHTVCGGNE